MYCQNCGAEIGDDANVCPYCGISVHTAQIVEEKDKKIAEMEKKIQRLEALASQSAGETSKSSSDGDTPEFQPWIFLFPLVFFVLFFVFFIILVRSH